MVVSGFVHAQTYPARPIRVIVPYPAGGGTDIVMRAIQPMLIERLGQPVVIDNRAGATGAIGTELVARASPDGYTLLLHTSAGLTIAPHTQTQARFDPLKDFTPITHATSAPFVLLVHPKVAATSVAQLIALAKARPGELNYASSGGGSSPHLAGLLLCKLAGINMVHIPYKGSGPATTDLLAGQVQTRFSSIPPAMPHVKSGRIRALATTGAKRFALLPELPTMNETLPGFVIDSWYAVLAPAGTPAAVVRKLNAEFVAALHAPDARARLRADGVEPVGSTPQQLGELLKADFERWGPLVKEAGARAD
jgi:tripartite-type tricarboxylate transporter receptor subunit TctC